MGALAQRERVAVRGGVDVAPRPERPRARRRPATSRPTSWNVLAEEIVPFQVPAPYERATRPRRDQAGRLVGPPTAHKIERPLSRVDQVEAKPRTVVARNQAAARSVRVSSQPRGLRRLLPGAATLAVLVSVWFGVSAMAGMHRPALAVPAAAVKVHGGYLYIARPGDTLWSIASALEPGGDPRVLVAQLAQQLHGGQLVVGDELKLP